MTHAVKPQRFNIPFGMNTIVGILAGYWLSILLFGGIRSLQIVLGTILVLLVPGYLVMQLGDVRPDRFGVFLISVVGTSTVIASLASMLTASILTALGAGRSISVFPLAVTFTGIVLGLLGLVYAQRGGLPNTGFSLPQRPYRYLLLLQLPVAGVLAATTMRWFGTNAGSFLFISMVAVSVLLLSRVRAPEQVYPFAVFTIILGLLLHRNFTSPHIIGADIQGMYAIADHVYTTGSWLPSMPGIGDSIPVMTLVPASIATLLGAPLTMTFKLFFVTLFALVPLGLYYFSRDLFDTRVAFFGALFFSFYHLSFAFTPGKQLVAEFFVLLTLITLSLDNKRPVQPVLLTIFSAGIVLTHYGVAYVFGLSLLFAALALTLTRRFIDGFEGHISVVYPVVFLCSATGWYGLTTPGLLDRIFSIPGGILAQLSVIFTGGSIEQSGATYISSNTTFLQYLNILLYATIALLIGLGLIRLIAHSLWKNESETNITTPKYTAIAIPFFAFLVASYFLVLNIWADRVFQMTLLILAPLIPLSYQFLIAPLKNRFSTSNEINLTIPLTVFMIVLLFFSSGFVFAAVGDANVSTFESDANDLSFDQADMQAVEWLLENGEISREQTTVASDDKPLFVDSPNDIQIYTDSTTYHLLRSTLPDRYYNTELVMLKNEWRPTISWAEINEGYILLRDEAIGEELSSGAVNPSKLTEEEVSDIKQLGTVVYDYNGVQIVRVVGSGSG